MAIEMQPPTRPSSAELRLARSHATFVGHVWPLIRHKFGNGELLSAEGQPEALARALDFAGIDYLLDVPGTDLFGIAQRTNERRPGEKQKAWPWNTITMGPAQFNRLLRAWAAPMGRVTPAVIVQSYVTRDEHAGITVDSVGVVRTTDFLSYAATGDRSVVEWSGTPFYSWTFDELASSGVIVDRFPSPLFQSPFGRSMPETLALPPGD